MSDRGVPDPARRRLDVAAVAVRLYAEHGYEATSADQIAAAAGLSRSTFFRQFRSKEDVVFADHDTLLEQAGAFLAEPHPDPWEAVCRAAELVFAHFAALGDLAHLRYEVVRREPGLRDKELVTTFRYERLFRGHLLAALPGLDPLDAVRFAATVVSTQNYCLRGLMRGEPGFDARRLTAELDTVRRLFGVAPREGAGEDGGAGAHDAGPAAARGRLTQSGGADEAPRPDDIVVAVFPRSAAPEDIARKVREALGRRPAQK